MISLRQWIWSWTYWRVFRLATVDKLWDIQTVVKKPCDDVEVKINHKTDILREWKYFLLLKCTINKWIVYVPKYYFKSYSLETQNLTVIKHLRGNAIKISADMVVKWNVLKCIMIYIIKLTDEFSQLTDVANNSRFIHLSANL
jgi:hypothetical protein